MIMRIVAAIVFVPFIGWGIFALRRRYRYHEDLSVLLEGATILFVVLFLAFEMAQLRLWLRSQPGFYIFAVLGMFVAVLALYGHMVISLTSRIIVDIVVPGDDPAPDQPRLGPAEYLEHCHDYESALGEYLVIGRIYPRNPVIHVRIADNLLRLSRPEEAVTWLKRALEYLDSADKSLPVTTRLCEVYGRHLHAPDEARGVLDQYLEQYPDAPETALVREHLAQLEGAGAAGALPGLVRLDEAPLRVEALGTSVEDGETRSADALPDLERLDAAFVENAAEEPQESPREEPAQETPGPAIELEPMDQEPDSRERSEAGVEEPTNNSPSVDPM